MEDTTTHDVQTSNQSDGQDVTTVEATETKKEKNTVAYETFDKAMKKLKATEKLLNEQGQKLRSFEESKLTLEGKKDELIKKLKAEKEAIEKAEQEKTSRYANKVKTNFISAKAKELGCVDAEALLKLIDINEVEVNEDFELDANAVQAMLEQSKKRYHYLFGAKQVSVQDGVPSNQVKKTKSLSEMSKEELIKYARDNADKFK